MPIDPIEVGVTAPFCLVPMCGNTKAPGLIACPSCQEVMDPELRRRISVARAKIRDGEDARAEYAKVLGELWDRDIS